MSEPRNPRIIDLIMSRMPPENKRLCPVEEEGCACMGCANHDVSEDEFNLWKERHEFCEHCGHFKE